MKLAFWRRSDEEKFLEALETASARKELSTAIEKLAGTLSELENQIKEVSKSGGL